MTVYVLDHFYLIITLLITVGYQLSGFFVAWVLQFDKITGENIVYVDISSLTLLFTVYRLYWRYASLGFWLVCTWF